MDGIRHSSFKAILDREIKTIIRKTKNTSYKFTPYRPRFILKGAGKPPRILSIPTIRDRVTLRAINEILAAVFPDAKILRPHIYIKTIHGILLKAPEDMAFVRIDVKEFFPSIPHDLLLKKVSQRIRSKPLLHLIKQAVSTRTANLLTEGKSVPQGLSISNILSSIFLRDLDSELKKDLSYFRYVDDILVICKMSEAENIFSRIRDSMAELTLICHEPGFNSKSKICAIESGIDYLGFHLTPAKISVRQTSFTRMYENLLSVFTSHGHAKKPSDDTLVWRLNLKITGCIFEEERYGWLFFFSQINDLRQLGRLDNFVTRQLATRGLGHLRPKVKKFIRAYHEIRKNLDQTAYIPKYDNFTIEQMIVELANSSGESLPYIKANYTEDAIRQKFLQIISRQTRQLEKDLIAATDVS